jgi:Tol biopolymer transport system component
MSHETAMGWSISIDKDMKQALALQRSTPATEVFRVAMAMHAREPETRSWSAFKVDSPTATDAAKSSASIVDGKMWPDGKQIVWSNGTIIWTTALNGKDAKRVGDDAIPPAGDLAVDPTGQWIVFSSPTPTRGRNLMAIHKSGRCLKTLTELPGDETDPAFSPDGSKLLFALRQGDASVIGEIPFGSPAAIAAACP